VERERKEQSGKKTREWRTCWKVAVVMRKGDGSKVEKQIKKKNQEAKAWEKLLKDKETQSNQQRRKMK
jgi:hypothetical protein